MFREHTPTESYVVKGRAVFVKRDDLYGSWPAPPLAKLRGARILLSKLYSQGVRLVGCWDTRISALGQGIAACAREFPGMKVIICYHTIKDAGVHEAAQNAETLGAEVLPVLAGRITISFACARRIVQSRGGFMLPFGLECSETVDAVRLEASTISKKYTRGGTVVVCTGSGVTLAGLILGLSGKPERFVAVSAGRSPLSIQRCLKRYAGETECTVQIEPSRWPYNTAIHQECPFPSHPYYDLKARHFLTEQPKRLRDPVFFWNIGA